MKFCPVVPEICCGQVHGSRKERKKERKRKRRSRIIIIIIIIRNGAKTISLQTLFGRLNNKKRSQNNKSPNIVWET
jgi:flagellar basal body-associated protein FliL